MKQPTLKKQYRIYTEAINIEQTITEVSDCFASFSVFNVEGHFEGLEELSLCIEIITEGKEGPLVKTLAESIKKANKQKAVLITCQDVLTLSV